MAFVSGVCRTLTSKGICFSINISVQSIITRVKGYISLKETGIDLTTASLDGQIGKLRNLEYKKSTQVIIFSTYVIETTQLWSLYLILKALTASEPTQERIPVQVNLFFQVHV